MPHIDPAAKAWELEQARRVGAAVQLRRKALGLTAQQLAQRTAGLGYPVTRVAISKIEGNMRAGKLDVAELLVLAHALEIPPALLLFPEYPDGQVEALPGQVTDSETAVTWLSGALPPEEAIHEVIDGIVKYPNVGVELVNGVRQSAETTAHRYQLSAMLTTRELHGEDAQPIERLIAANQQRQSMLRTNIHRAQAQLWGEDGEGDGNE